MGWALKDRSRFRSAKLIQVLDVEVLEGDGEKIPYRPVHYYLSERGIVLAKHDPLVYADAGELGSSQVVIT